MNGDYDFQVSLKLRSDDVLELKQLRDRAQVESREARIAYDGRPAAGKGACRLTDRSRDAMRSVETLDRILQQII